MYSIVRLYSKDIQHKNKTKSVKQGATQYRCPHVKPTLHRIIVEHAVLFSDGTCTLICVAEAYKPTYMRPL